MRRNFGDAHAFVTDVTSGYAQLNVQGPLARVPVAVASITAQKEAPTPNAMPRESARKVGCTFASSDEGFQWRVR